MRERVQTLIHARFSIVPTTQHVYNIVSNINRIKQLKRIISTLGSIFLIMVIMLTILTRQGENRHISSQLYNQLRHFDFGELDNDNSLIIVSMMDYLPTHIVKLFEHLTGINVVLDFVDSASAMDANLLTDAFAYDIVIPTAWPQMEYHMQAGTLQRIDKKKIDMSVFDPDLMTHIRTVRNMEDYCIPYQWGVCGIVINPDIIERIFPNTKIDSYDFLLNPVHLRKLVHHGVALHGGSDIYNAILVYLGHSPYTKDQRSLLTAIEYAKSIKNYIARYIDNGDEEVAKGNCAIAVALGSEVRKKLNHIRKAEMQKPTIYHNIVFIIPKEGANLWMDVCAIPKRAKHVKNAYAFLRFLSHPLVSAEISNTISCATPVTEARQFIRDDLITDPLVYPTSQVVQNAYVDAYVNRNVHNRKENAFLSLKDSNVSIHKNT